MPVSRSHGVGTRTGGLLAVSLAVLALTSLVFSSSPAPSIDAPAGQAALRAVIDPETGTLTFDSVAMEKSADAELQNMLSRSTEGLRAVVYPHGGVGVNLQGRFQSAAVAHIDADGHLTTNCSEHLAEIEAFLHGPAPAPAATPKLEVQ